MISKKILNRAYLKLESDETNNITIITPCEYIYTKEKIEYFLKRNFKIMFLKTSGKYKEYKLIRKDIIKSLDVVKNNHQNFHIDIWTCDKKDPHDYSSFERFGFEPEELYEDLSQNKEYDDSKYNRMFDGPKIVGICVYRIIKELLNKDQIKDLINKLKAIVNFRITKMNDIDLDNSLSFDFTYKIGEL